MILPYPTQMIRQPIALHDLVNPATPSGADYQTMSVKVRFQRSRYQRKTFDVLESIMP